MESDLGTCLKEYLAESAHPIRQERAIIFNRNFGIYIVTCRFASADPRRFLLAQGNTCYSRHCLYSSPITIISLRESSTASGGEPDTDPAIPALRFFLGKDACFDLAFRKSLAQNASLDLPS